MRLFFLLFVFQCRFSIKQHGINAENVAAVSIYKTFTISTEIMVNAMQYSLDGTKLYLGAFMAYTTGEPFYCLDIGMLSERQITKNYRKKATINEMSNK